MIRGTTDVAQHKGTATRLAKSAGAIEVENRIELSKEAHERLSHRSRGPARRVRVRFVEIRDHRR